MPAVLGQNISSNQFCSPLLVSLDTATRGFLVWHCVMLGNKLCSTCHFGCTHILTFLRAFLRTLK